MGEDSMLAQLVSRVVESPFPELWLAAPAGQGRMETSVILARSTGHDGKFLRGRGPDRVVIDEAAFCPERVLSAVVPPMLAVGEHRGLDMLSTPFGKSGTYYELFMRGQVGDGDVRSFRFPSSASKYVSQEYLEEQRGRMTQLAYDTEFDAEFLDDQASVFRHDIIQAAIDADIRPGTVDGHRYVIGFDPAKYSDRSGVVVLDITEKPHRAVEVLDIGGREYLRQAARVVSLSEAYNRAPVLLDSTSHDQMLEELQRQGVKASGYKFTSESKSELIDGLVMALEHGRIRIPHHADLIRELTYYRFATKPAGNVKLGAPEGVGHYDDLVTALALATMAGHKRREYGVGFARVQAPRETVGTPSAFAELMGFE
jgi:phage FluMu gp28-like protein